MKKQKTKNKTTKTTTTNKTPNKKQTKNPKQKPKKLKLSTKISLAIILIIIIAVGIFSITQLKSNKTLLKNNETVVGTANNLEIIIESEPKLKIGLKDLNEPIEITTTQTEYIKKLFDSESTSPTQTDLVNEAAIREILYSNALKKGLTFSDEQVNKLLNNPGFQEQLNKLNTSKETFLKTFKNEIKKDYLIQEYFNQEIVENLPLQDAVNASHILICFNGTTMCHSNKTKEEALAFANKLLKIVKNDSSIENFEKVARQYSDGPSKANGGNLGVFARGEMILEFENAAFNTSVNEISDIVETSYGYHIIRVNEKTKKANSQAAIGILMNLRTEILNKGNIQVLNESTE